MTGSAPGGARPFEDRVAVVTGAASGIGAATAALLAERGAHVVVADLDRPAADVLADDLTARGLAASAAGVDVSDEAQVSALFDRVRAEHGRLDVLHNNAAAMGLTFRDPVVTRVDVASWDRTFAVNARGVLLGCKHAIPLMLEDGGGAIVNTTSISGDVGELTMSAYGASKAAVSQLTRAVATQWGRQGIRCNAVAPGLILSPSGEQTPEPLQEIYRRHVLTPHLGTPDDVARLVAFLASDEARYITAQVLRVDGGLVDHHPIVADFADWAASVRADRAAARGPA
ncbi:SDR family NAD(P)-dependent oxidoreductase [Nocardioides sp. LHD-245]|uniref:SDR family NAD(P)-dependent oxidoreductase n=1 Tax=Nocardioides sp. LHD-245 TaxID=3051387 RepID=UPI0027DFDEA3|nr:SDR family NAD(P)-dependent oxidoreductase [Nocardioides sp. LHD-245]